MKVLLIVILVVLASLPMLAQQEHINRYDAFTGFTYMVTPDRNLIQRGVNGSFGVNVRRWLALGGDFSYLTGSTGITPNETELGPVLTPLIPPGVVINVPITAHTYSFAVGPQFNWRRWDKVTLFMRPGFGGFHESADLDIPPIVNPLLVSQGLPALTSPMKDTTYFYGGGVGFDVNATKHVGFRFSVDYARTHLFSNLLGLQNNLRFSIGPTWKWGEMKQ